MSRKDGGDHVSPVLRDEVPVRASDFLDEAMSPEQSEQTADSGTSAASLGIRYGCGRVEDGLKISVADALDRKLTPMDCSEQADVVLIPRLEASNPCAGEFRRPAESGDQLSQRLGRRDGGQSVQVPVVGGMGKLGPAMKIGDAGPEVAPRLWPFGISFGRPEDLEAFAIVDRGLHAEDGAFLVVEFDGVLAHPVLEANSFDAIFEAADNLALEIPMGPLSQEAHDVGTGKGRHAVTHQPRVNLRHGRRILEQEIGGPLALKSTPVVRERSLFEHPGVVRVELSGDSIESLGPSGLELLIHEFLSCRNILDPRKAVLPPAVRQSLLVHLAGEPLPAVHADLDREGEPCLDPGVHEAEDGVDEVVVQEQALASARNELELLQVPVSVDLVSDAGLDCREETDEALANAVSLSDPQGNRFLVRSAALKVFDRPMEPTGFSERGFLEPLRHRLCKSAEVLEQDPPFPKETHHAGNECKLTKSSPEDQPVEPAQNSYDPRPEACYKTVHGRLLRRKKSVLQLPSYFWGDTVSTNRRSSPARSAGCLESRSDSKSGVAATIPLVAA